MAKYCTKCGKKLEEGEVCNCEEILKTNNIDFTGSFTKLINLVKGLFTNPIKVIKEFKNEKNFSLAIIVTIITSLIVSLFMLMLVKYWYQETVTSTYMFGYNRVVDIPYFKYFIIYFILLLASSFVYALVYYLVNNKIFKVKISYQSAFNILASLAIYLAFGTVIAVITSVFTLTISLIFIVIAALFNIIVLTLTNKEVLKLNDVKTMYSMILYYLINAFVTFLFILIF